MIQPLTVVGYRTRVEELEHELRLAQARIHTAEQRAALAEKSSRDAWAFTKALRGTRAPNVRGSSST